MKTPEDYERGFIDGMQKQMQSSVDKAVNRMAQPERSMKVEGPLHVVCQCNKCNTQPEQEPVAWEQFYPDIGKPQIAFNAEVIGYVAPQRTWVGLTDEDDIDWEDGGNLKDLVKAIEAKLKEKNNV